MKISKNLRAVITEVEKTQKNLDKMLLLIAAKACPYSLGETVTIKGYNHVGKQGIVDRISYMKEGWSDNYIWKIHGVVLKKNQCPSNFSFYWNEGQE